MDENNQGTVYISFVEKFLKNTEPETVLDDNTNTEFMKSIEAHEKKTEIIVLISGILEPPEPNNKEINQQNQK